MNNAIQNGLIMMFYKLEILNTIEASILIYDLFKVVDKHE